MLGTREDFKGSLWDSGQIIPTLSKLYSGTERFVDESYRTGPTVLPATPDELP